MNKGIYYGTILLSVILFSLGMYALLPEGTPTKKNIIVQQQNNLGTVRDITPVDHIPGNTHAQIHIIEYADFECLHCKLFQPTINQILKSYGSKITWAMRLYPLPQDANGEKEAEAAECVNEIGGTTKFWKYSDAIFTRTAAGGTGFALENLAPLAKAMGVNQNSFQSCLGSGKYYQKIQQNSIEAQNADIPELPSTIIIDQHGNRQLVSGLQPFSVYQLILNQALK